MPARTPHTAKAVTPTAQQPPTWDWLNEWNRQQMVVANEGAYTVYRGFEAMRRIQEETARAVTKRHAAIAEKLRKPSGPLDVALLQGELLRDDLSSAAKYWQDLTGVALEMNTQLLNCAAHLVDTEDVFAATAPRFLHS